MSTNTVSLKKPKAKKTKSKVVSARLYMDEEKKPLEANALKVFDVFIAKGYSPREVICHALNSLGAGSGYEVPRSEKMVAQSILDSVKILTEITERLAHLDLATVEHRSIAQQVINVGNRIGATVTNLFGVPQFADEDDD